ncbi:MAG: type II toxin-antitoxin system VapC family toxin [Bryobacterales bacterium]|nr:type II toxin-antitoxin system VapC family toxin [Bryobacterales bacterium]
MRYWDASALAPLVVAEPASSLVREWLAEDEWIITWVWSRTEIVSAIERRTREGSLSRMQRREVLERFDALSGSWDEVTDVLAVRPRANALLARHPLRAIPCAPPTRLSLARRCWCRSSGPVRSRSSAWTSACHRRPSWRAFAYFPRQ